MHDAPSSSREDVRPAAGRPHLIYVAIGFPPASKSSTYRLLGTANEFVRQGWDVTVLNLSRDSWAKEFGLDDSLWARVDPRIEVVEIPEVRQDLETDIRTFGRARALDSVGWIYAWQEEGLARFPERIWGRWRDDFSAAAVKVHEEHPADLILASCAPYMAMAVARDLYEHAGVPYAIDYRDGWAIDVIGGSPAFEPDAEKGLLERQVLSDARSLWTVNDPIGDFYRERYPELAERIHVVRNGFDPVSICSGDGRPDPAAGLTFGHLGVITSPPWILESVLEGWRLARYRDPLVARSRLEFRGQIGAGASREANAHSAMIRSAEAEGVSFGGPVAQSDVPALMDGWDVLVMMIMGGRYMTSGKVYEYAATGLPVMSVTEVEHESSYVLAGHPLWEPPVGFDISQIADQFCRAAHLAVGATDQDRRQARAAAHRFERSRLLEPAVRTLSADVLGDRALREDVR